MAKFNSFADFIGDWRRLLAALDANPDALPDLSAQRPALEAVLKKLEEVSARQDALRVESKGNAAEARLLMQRGADLALQVRAAIRAHLGPRNPKLAEFRVRVLGGRRPRPVPEEPTGTKAPVRGRRRRGSQAEADTEAEAQEEPEPATS